MVDAARFGLGKRNDRKGFNMKRYTEGVSRKKLPRKIVVRNVFILLFSLIFLAAGGVCIYGEVMLSRINFVEDGTGGNGLFASTVPDSLSPADSEGSGGNSGTAQQGEVKLVNGLHHDDGIVNILVMGVDDYQENDVGRTDSMILLSLDTRHKKLKMTSFMRDMYVTIPGLQNPNRINTAYSTGGPSGLVTALEANFSVDIDRWVVVTFDAFTDIINAMGGVEITLTQEEAEYLNTYSTVHSNLTAGTHTLGGIQARDYSRIRKIGDDFERTQRQRNVITAIVNKFKSSDLGTIHSVLYNTLNLITTNLQKDEILGLAGGALEYLNYDLEQCRVPGDGEYDARNDIYIGGYKASVLVPHLDDCRRSLISFIYEIDEPLN